MFPLKKIRKHRVSTIPPTNFFFLLFLFVPFPLFLPETGHPFPFSKTIMNRFGGSGGGGRGGRVPIAAAASAASLASFLGQGQRASSFQQHRREEDVLEPVLEEENEIVAVEEQEQGEEVEAKVGGGDIDDNVVVVNEQQQQQQQPMDTFKAATEQTVSNSSVASTCTFIVLLLLMITIAVIIICIVRRNAQIENINNPNDIGNKINVPGSVKTPAVNVGPKAQMVEAATPKRIIGSRTPASAKLKTPTAAKTPSTTTITTQKKNQKPGKKLPPITPTHHVPGLIRKRQLSAKEMLRNADATKQMDHVEKQCEMAANATDILQSSSSSSSIEIKPLRVIGITVTDLVYDKTVWSPTISTQANICNKFFALWASSHTHMDREMAYTMFQTDLQAWLLKNHMKDVSLLPRRQIRDAVDDAFENYCFEINKLSTMQHVISKHQKSSSSSPSSSLTSSMSKNKYFQEHRRAAIRTLIENIGNACCTPTAAASSSLDEKHTTPTTTSNRSKNVNGGGSGDTKLMVLLSDLRSNLEHSISEMTHEDYPVWQKFYKMILFEHKQEVVSVSPKPRTHSLPSLLTEEALRNLTRVFIHEIQQTIEGVSSSETTSVAMMEQNIYSKYLSPTMHRQLEEQCNQLLLNHHHRLIQTTKSILESATF